MSENLKDMIDKAEEDEQSRALMEKTIEKLNMEVESLKHKLETQKEPFKILPVKQREEKEESEEIKILKEIIASLRDDVNQKDQEKEKLHEKVKRLTTELNLLKEKESDTIKEEILLKTQNSLNNLIEDYSRLETNNKVLKEKIAELQQEINETVKPREIDYSEATQSEGLREEIDSLKFQISSLEEKNKSLLHDIKLLETTTPSSDDLNGLIEKLTSNNSQLEKENKELSEKLEELKRDKLRMLNYEREISDLKMKINQLEEANQLLKKRDSILLAKTINVMDLTPQKGKKIDKDQQTQQPIQIKPIEPNLTQETKPKEPSKEDDKEVKKISSLKPNGIKPKKVLTPKTEDLNKGPTLVIEESDDETTRKWQCPGCGNTNKAQIRELDDKTRLIYSYPKIYAKKYLCGQCGKEWK